LAHRNINNSSKLALYFYSKYVFLKYLLKGTGWKGFINQKI